MMRYAFNTFAVINGTGFEFSSYGTRIGLRYSCDGWTLADARARVHRVSERQISHAPGVTL